MKANEAPEKIYISTNSQDGTYYISNQYKRLIEYVRKDAFIEKAEKYLNNKFGDVVNLRVSETLTELTTRQDFIERFKKYMND